MPSITYADKNNASSGATDLWRDVDANEVKAVVNAKQDGSAVLSALSSLPAGVGFIKKVGPSSFSITFPDCLLSYKVKAGHGFVVKNALTLSGTGVIVKISNPSSEKCIGIVVAVIDADNFLIALPGGYISGLSGLTEGSIHYAQADGTLSTVVTDLPVLLADTAASGFLLAGSSSGPSSILGTDWAFAANSGNFPSVPAGKRALYVALDDHGVLTDPDYVPSGSWMLSKNPAGSSTFADFHIKL